MIGKVILVVALSFAFSGQGQNQRPQPREIWNKLYTELQGNKFPHNDFLAAMIKGRKPGKALDIGIGEGRNALFLASQGWEVTGFDISDAGIRQVQEEARKRGLKVEALIEDVDRFDYGKQRWDLVAGMYMHEMITRNADKIVDSLKPEGILVIEGVHWDHNQKGVQGDYYGHKSNELLRSFDRLRVLFYEESTTTPYWMKNDTKKPIVRFLARKEP